MTRLPTVCPTRPLSQPVMTWLGVAPIVNPNGSPRDHDESKTLLVRQISPTYWVTTVCPLATTGPDPLIRVLVTSPAGGFPDLGMVMVGAVPALAVTVGSEPPPLDTVLPEADAVFGNSLIMSTTNTSVSLAVTPAWEFPVLP